MQEAPDECLGKVQQPDKPPYSRGASLNGHHDRSDAVIFVAHIGVSMAYTQTRLSSRSVPIRTFWRDVPCVLFDRCGGIVCVSRFGVQRAYDFVRFRRAVVPSNLQPSSLPH